MGIISYFLELQFRSLLRFSFFNLEQNKYSWRPVATWERFWTLKSLNDKKPKIQNQPNTNNKTNKNGLPTVFVILQTIYCVNYLLTVRNLKSDCDVHKHVFQFALAFISKISQWDVLLLNPHQLPKQLSCSFGKACAVFDFDSHMYPECVTLKQKTKKILFFHKSRKSLYASVDNIHLLSFILKAQSPKRQMVQLTFFINNMILKKKSPYYEEYQTVYS